MCPTDTEEAKKNVDQQMSKCAVHDRAVAGRENGGAQAYRDTA